MFNGAHVVIYSRDAAADRALFRDVLDFPHVDAGDGWLIFATPPGEIAFHPAENSTAHQFYLMCDDIEATRRALKEHGFDSDPVSDEGWGLLSAFTLPGGSRIGFYQPRHPRATPAG